MKSQRKKNKKSLFLCVLSTVLLFVSCVSTTPNDSTKNISSEKKIKEKTEVFTVENFIQKLQDCLAEGSNEEALALYSTVPEKYANDYTLLYIKASLLMSAGYYDEATVITTMLQESYPENTDVLTLASVIAKATGKTAQKSMLIKKILAIDPNHTDANTELANEQMVKKNFTLANRYYLKALGSDARNLEALAGYGQSSYYLGKLSDAEKTFKQMIEIDPKNAFAYSYLGKLEAEKPNYKTAAEYGAKAIEYAPEYYDYWMDYGSYMQQLMRYGEAEEALTRAIELRPDFFYGYVYRGGVYDEQDKVIEAYADFKKVVELNPKYYFAYESLGILAWGAEDYASAREGFSKAWEVYPASTSYPIMIAMSYFIEGDVKNGKDFLSKKVLKSLDRNSVEYAIARLFYDNVAPGTVAQKVENESNSNKRGKYLYYLATYYQIRGNDSLAQKYYIMVNEMQSPLFFEYRLNDWALKNYKK